MRFSSSDRKIKLLFELFQPKSTRKQKSIKQYGQFCNLFHCEPHLFGISDTRSSWCDLNRIVLWISQFVRENCSFFYYFFFFPSPHQEWYSIKCHTTIHINRQCWYITHIQWVAPDQLPVPSLQVTPLLLDHI